MNFFFWTVIHNLISIFRIIATVTIVMENKDCLIEVLTSFQETFIMINLRIKYITELRMSMDHQLPRYPKDLPKKKPLWIHFLDLINSRVQSGSAQKLVYREPLGSPVVRAAGSHPGCQGLISGTAKAQAGSMLWRRIVAGVRNRKHQEGVRMWSTEHDWGALALVTHVIPKKNLIYRNDMYKR